MAWGIYADEEGHLHVVPTDDAKKHELWDECWCEPSTEDDGKSFTHHSADGREQHEKQ